MEDYFVIELDDVDHDICDCSEEVPFARDTFMMGMLRSALQRAWEEWMKREIDNYHESVKIASYEDAKRRFTNNSINCLGYDGLRYETCYIDDSQCEGALWTKKS